MNWFNKKKYEYVDGYRVLRDTDRPWICTEQPYWWEDFFGPITPPTMFIDTNNLAWRNYIIELSKTPGAKYIKEKIKEYNATNRCTPD